MEALLWSLFAGSSLLLIWTLVKSRLSWAWLRGFALHLTIAAAFLYLLNYSSLLPGVYIPLNPITIGAVVALGLPGVALVAGLQWVIV